MSETPPEKPKEQPQPQSYASAVQYTYMNPYQTFPYYSYGTIPYSVPMPVPAVPELPQQTDMPEPLRELPGGLPPWRQTSVSVKNPNDVNPTRNFPQGKISVPISVSSSLKKPVVTTKNTVPIIQKPAPTAGSSDGWPQSLKSYVERCFMACKSDDERDKMESSLRAKINKAVSEGKINAINWAAEAIPSHIIYAPVEGKKVFKVTKHKNDDRVLVKDQDVDKKEARAKRFMEDQISYQQKLAKRARSAPKLTNMAEDDLECVDFGDALIVGYSQDLEKPYLRLTSAPDPSTVRPLNVLEKCLKYHMDKWYAKKDYGSFCAQMKSIRQDLTVQRIRNEFTVEVYEHHARVALENEDLGEYNQCQSQLKLLYEQGISGHESEFTAYRILYLIRTNNCLDYSGLLYDLNPNLRSDPVVENVLRLRYVINTGNAAEFFKIYQNLPELGRYIIDRIVYRVRLGVLRTVSRSFRPYFSMTSLMAPLGFDSLASCSEFLSSVSAVVLNGDLDCKATSVSVGQ